MLGAAPRGAARSTGMKQEVTERHGEHPSGAYEAGPQAAATGGPDKIAVHYHSPNSASACSCLAAGSPPRSDTETQRPFGLGSVTLIVTSDRAKRAPLPPESLGPEVDLPCPVS